MNQYFTWWERLEAVSPRVPVPTSALSLAHAAGGRRAVLRAQREIWLPDINYFADFAPLWKDARFTELQARMGSPPAVTL